MYPILKGFSTIAMTYGVTLLVLAFLLWLYQTWHKKKHGPIPKGRMMTINVGMFILAALIALPISIAKITGSKRKSATYRMASLAQQQMESDRKRQQDAAANLKPEGAPESRSRVDPDEVDRQRQLKERQAAERRYMEEMREMREADSYRPPSGPATPEQKAFDDRIVVANQELQDLKARQQACEDAYEAARGERERLMKERPVDGDRLREVSDTLHESMREKIRMAGPIGEKRREITTLLNDRKGLGE